MNKYEQDALNLSIQQMAFALRENENKICDAWLAKEVSDEFYGRAMDATAAYVAYAITQGLSRKDLPPC